MWEKFHGLFLLHCILPNLCRWNQKGSYAALHTMNKLRLPLIKQAFTAQSEYSDTPLSGKRILDVGCGGGLLSEVRQN